MYFTKHFRNYLPAPTHKKNRILECTEGIRKSISTQYLPLNELNNNKVVFWTLTCSNYFSFEGCSGDRKSEVPPDSIILVGFSWQLIYGHCLSLHYLKCLFESVSPFPMKVQKLGGPFTSFIAMSQHTCVRPVQTTLRSYMPVLRRNSETDQLQGCTLDLLLLYRLGAIDWMFVSSLPPPAPPPKKVHVLKLIPNVLVFGGGATGRYLGNFSEALNEWD